MSHQKIGWQKYEDLLEQQINSPIIEMISNSVKNVAKTENIGQIEKTLYKEVEDEFETQEMLATVDPFFS